MKRITTLLLLNFLLFSCVTEKKRLEICQSCPLKIERKDSIIIKEVEKPVPFAVPGPSVEVIVKSPCADMCDSTGKLKKGFFKEIVAPTGRVIIKEKNNSLSIECQSDSLKGVIKVKEREIQRLSSEIREVPARCDKKHFGTLDTFFVWSGRILWIIIILLILYFILKGRIKWLP